MHIKIFRKKISFCIVYENYDDCHHRKTTRTSIYTKSKKLRNVFIYTKQDTFQRARQFPLRFYIQKAIHLTLRNFHEIFEVGYMQKARHFAKIYTICDTFLYTKTRHFHVTRFFIEFLKFAEGGDIYLLKNNLLCVTFLF